MMPVYREFDMGMWGRPAALLRSVCSAAPWHGSVPPDHRSGHPHIPMSLAGENGMLLIGGKSIAFIHLGKLGIVMHGKQKSAMALVRGQVQPVP